MRQRLTTRLLLTAILAANALYAEIPGKISYQGRLTDNVGLPLSGQHALTFKIFVDSAGLGQIWTETQNGVVVTNGLFSVILGSVTPIPLNAFEGQTCYLGIAIDGGIQLSPLHPMVSTPYAFHADFAGRAPLGGGWSVGNNVWLENSDKKVGIGTMTPSYKLDVVGTARASDSLIGSKLRLGSPSDDGRLNLYGNQTTGPALTLREFSNGGGALELFHSDGSTISYLAADGDGSGGYMSVRRSTLDYGLIMDGNYSGSNNPRISILGADRSVFFNLGDSGDSSVMLPTGSISHIECRNEAGISNAERSTGSVSLPDGVVTTVLTRSCYFPTDGWVAVIGTCSYDFWHTSGESEEFAFAVSNVAGTIPADQGFLRRCSSGWSTFNFRDFATVHGYFAVDAGAQSLYLLGKAAFVDGAFANDAQLTIMFFPTNYFWLGKGDYADNPGQEEIDQQTQSRIDAEVAKLRVEFEAKLEQMRVEMEKQLKTADFNGKM